MAMTRGGTVSELGGQSAFLSVPGLPGFTMTLLALLEAQPDAHSNSLRYKEFGRDKGKVVGVEEDDHPRSLSESSLRSDNLAIFPLSCEAII